MQSEDWEKQIPQNQIAAIFPKFMFFPAAELTHLDFVYRLVLLWSHDYCS
jgi:hypothetical protein